MLKTLYRKYLSSFADHPLATDIQWERHNLFMTEVGSRMISAVIGAALVGAMFYKSAPMSSILIWFGGICFVGINSWLLIRYHKRHPEPEHSTRNLAYVRRWHWLNLYQAAIWGLLWALTPFLFFPDASNIQVLSVLMMVVVLSSTPSITMGCYPDIYITFLTPVFFSFGFPLFNIDFGEEWLPAVTPPLTWVSLVVFSIMIHRTHMESIVLRLEHRRNELMEQDKNNAKTRFIAVASHDLRQPVQAARLYAEAMANNPAVVTKDIIGKLNASLLSASQLLDRLLDISRIDAGVVNVNRDTVFLPTFVEQLVATHSVMAKQKGLELVSEVEAVSVYCDAAILMEIIDNVLTNAIRYTAQGRVVISGQREKGKIRLRVSDTGIGMTPVQVRDAFEEFVQVADCPDDTGQGMGLGLPIVKRLCNLHNIEFRLDSDKGRGTCFSLWLDETATLEDLPTPPSRIKDLQQLKVLLVDDEESVRDALSVLLVGEQHDVWAAESIPEAMTMLTDEGLVPDLLITDDRLPGGFGAKDVIRTVRGECGADLPAMIITGNTDPKRIQELKALEAPVLFKPVSGANILGALEALRKQG